MPIIQVLFSNLNNFYDILKAHKKLCKSMCLVQNVKSCLILTKSPTYSPWFFLKIGPFLT